MPRYKLEGVRALSVNKCWQGQRFKTPEYKNYERALLFLLPKFEMPKPPYILKIEVGFSNKLSDADNIVKPFLDILQKKYNFNDYNIYDLRIIKTIVDKGSEFITFEIKTLINSAYPQTAMEL